MRAKAAAALVAAAAAITRVTAQSSPSPSPSPVPYQYALVDDGMRSVAAAIKTGAFVNATSCWDRLAYATDTFGPRFSGTPGLEAALDWIAATAAGTDGLRTIQEPVQVPQWVRGREWAQMVSPRNKTLHFVGLGMSNGTAGQVITAPVVVVGSYDEFMALPTATIAGNIVLFDAPFVTYGQTVAYRVSAAQWVAARGGVAALIRSVGPYGIQTPHTGGSATATIPGGALSMEDSSQLHRMYARGQKVRRCAAVRRAPPHSAASSGHSAASSSVSRFTASIASSPPRSLEADVAPLPPPAGLPGAADVGVAGLATPAEADAGAAVAPLKGVNGCRPATSRCDRRHSVTACASGCR